jgi:hypothetical protein
MQALRDKAIEPFVAVFWFASLGLAMTELEPFPF